MRSRMLWVGWACLLAVGVAVEIEERLPPPSRPRPRPSGGFSSFLSGFLGSVTKTATVSDCPGKCIHSIASLICDQVLENVDCGSANMRCCVEKGGGMPPLTDGLPPLPKEKEDKVGTTTTEKTTTTEATTTTKKKRRRKKKTTTTSTTTTTTTTTTKTTTTALTTKTTPATTTDDTSDDYDDPEYEYTSPASNRTCPGVCVADRISCFCEAIYDVDDLCKTNLRCCVAIKIFGSDDPPKELIIPKDDARCKGDNDDDDDKEDMETSESTTTEVIKRREPEKKPDSDKPSKNPSSIPAEKRCRGTCVTGFFALLCDEIDRAAICPGSGRCCITRGPPKRPNNGPRPRPPTTPRPRPLPPPPPSKPKCPGVCIPNVMIGLCNAPSRVVHNTVDCKKGTQCCDKRPATASDKIDVRQPPPTRPPRPQPPQRQPQPQPQRPAGPDFTKLLLSAAPLLLGATAGNPTSDTISNLLPLLTPMLTSYLNQPRPTRPPPPPQNNVYRPQYERRTPPPTLRTTATTTTTTTRRTTTEKPDPRPECPGTCIAPYLSFTCFGNAETTELFKCPKKKTICCSPRTAVKEQKEIASRPPPPPQKYREPPGSFGSNAPRFDLPQITNNHIRRNDSVFTGTNQVDRYPFPTTTLSERPPLQFPVTNKFVCGVKGTYRSGRVVGGEDAVPGEWCWQVALINSLNQYLCGGALIGTQWVLTAAHCVTNIVRAGDAIYVRVGDHDLTQKFGSPGAQTLRVATTYIHHNHNSQTLDNDIALLKLHGEADLKDGSCLVCLPARGTSQQAGKKCTVTGYGYMGETGPIPLRVRAAKVPIVNDNECVRKINTVTEKIFILPASSFCAGGIEGHDACQGDGGGPLVCEDTGYYELTGLVSWGFGCGRKDVPAVYVKVSSFIGWINQIISVNNS